MSNKRIGTSAISVNLLLAAISVTCVFPLVWLAYSSLKTENEFVLNMFSLPTTLQWNNYYLALIKSRVLYYFLNTIFNGVTSVIVIVFFSFCIGYFLARYDFKGKALVNTMLTLGLVVPVHSLLVPMYIQFKLLNLVDHRGALILPYLGVMLPLGAFLIESYIKTLPRELEEAAEIEGASLFTAIVRIIVPLSAPILVTVIIIGFNFAWNEFPFSLVLNASEKVRNIAVGIMNFASDWDTKWTLRIAACVISLFPVTILYVFFNKQIIKGMTEGSLKG
jgi:raffinose/stachyose/melibiose transport system permease protein